MTPEQIRAFGPAVRDAPATGWPANQPFWLHGTEASFWAWLDRLAEPRKNRRIEGRATTTLERTFGGDVWLGVVGIWNALVAALLRERLDPDLVAALQGPWRATMREELNLRPQA
jgi:hypothetical protein